ncbi:MAG: SPOR domain-containing protein, partial [Pseudomonadota bacterium]
MFQLRSGSGATPASTPGGRQQPPSIEMLRRRARQRLIGAAVLVGIAIIALPMLFESQPRPIPVDIVIEIPARHAVEPLSVPGRAAGEGRTGERQGGAPAPAQSAQAAPPEP